MCAARNTPFDLSSDVLQGLFTNPWATPNIVDTGCSYRPTVPALALAGLTVGVTADRRSGEQAQMLAQRGARVVCAPVLRTAPIDDDTQALAATLNLVATPPDVVIASTALGVRTWWALADAWGLTEGLTRVIGRSYVAARGPKAAGALAAVGLEAAWRAPTATLAEVVGHVVDRGVANRRVALLCDGGGPGGSATVLRTAGAEVFEIKTYRWDLPEDRDPARRLVGAICDGRVDAVTFTAAPAVDNLFAIATDDSRVEELRQALQDPTLAMCIGPVCRDAAVAQGVSSALEPATARLGGMVKALADAFVARRKVVVIDGMETSIQGALVSAGGVDVTLTAGERSVFAALLRRPGAVVSRAVLSASHPESSSVGAKTSGGADERALEATVGRLRRRLAPTGIGVEAVPRRGYRLVCASGVP